jgi:hypothetical protein
MQCPALSTLMRTGIFLQAYLIYSLNRAESSAKKTGKNGAIQGFFLFIRPIRQFNNVFIPPFLPLENLL